MRRSDFHYDLPAELIAQHPTAERRASRLLVVNGGCQDRRFPDLVEWLKPGDLMVFNDTRVIPARLAARKPTGGTVELLIERVLDGAHVLAQARASKPIRTGSTVIFEDGSSARIVGRRGDFYQVELPQDAEAFLERCGRIPLPPYIERAPSSVDRERYQTIFARTPGAVAAPTAGLHFDQALLDAIRARGVDLGYVTLHVGAGTFQPVRVDDLGQHRMHAERVWVTQALCRQIEATRERGGRVWAVGTTVVRSLETAALAGSEEGKLRPFAGETELFIVPGFRFRVVDALLTNFHLPESTLLMLVCAFAGYDRVMSAYRHAVAERYRFFSYGDAMLLPQRAPAA